jgi:hypothetical protein
MSDDYFWSIVLSVFLTLADLVTAFFSFLGGANALGRSGGVRYLTISFGVVLLYLSSGLWTKQRWKLYARLAMYGVPFCFLFVSVAVVMVVRGAHFMDLAVCEVLIATPMIIAASWAHLRLTLRRRYAKH